MKKQIFETVLKRHPDMNATYFMVPFKVEDVYRTKGMAKVKINIKGISHRGLLMPLGNGKHCMGIKQELRKQMGIEAGDKIKVSMEPDMDKRIVKLRPDFKKVLNKNKKLKGFFDTLSYTRRKEYAGWIESAIKDETRKSRLKKSMEMLAKGIKHP